MQDQRSDSSIQRQRSIKHHKLLRYIEGYKRTPQQIRKLDKIKANTVMEINLRYIKSQHNRKYRFPKMEDSDPEQQNQNPSFAIFQEKENQMYNLFSQNDNNKGKSIPSKVISYDPLSSKRIKSLQNDRHSLEKERITRLNLKKKQNSLKKLTRKSSFVDPKHHKSNVKLPEIYHHNYSPRKFQNCLTQGPEQSQIKDIIGKKLVTQTSVGRKSSIKGVERYVRQMKHQNRQNSHMKKKKNINFLIKQMH